MGENKLVKIYIDESGELEPASRDDNLFVLSLVMIESAGLFYKDCQALETELLQIGDIKDIHTAPLVRRGKDYNGLTLKQRRDIFWAMNRLKCSRGCKIFSFIINRAILKNESEAKLLLSRKITAMLADNSPILFPYDEVEICYDCGQNAITNILIEAMESSRKGEFTPCFNKTKTRPFQLADFNTFVERLAFKLNSGGTPNRSEFIFFSEKELKLLCKQAIGQLLNEQ